MIFVIGVCFYLYFVVIIQRVKGLIVDGILEIMVFFFDFFLEFYIFSVLLGIYVSKCLGCRKMFDRVW